MAKDLVRLVPTVRTEDRTGFSGTGTAYFIKWLSEDNQKEVWWIYAAGAPGSDFDDAPLDSLYTDTTNHKLYIKTAASTWTVVGAQTA